MLFNSLGYIVFLPCIFLVYWSIARRNVKFQNLFLLVSSYVFYSFWDWRFLSLILISTCLDYLVGIKIYQTNNKVEKKRWLFLSIGVNLTILGFFKYFNFFTQSLADFLSLFQIGFSTDLLINIVLPVGISFYTFQTMSYSLDIFSNKIKPTKNIINFATYVAFFPQLVAGPIERASNLLPQLNKSRKFNYQQTVDGLKLILWGMFKKVVIADSLAPMVNDIFSNYGSYSASTLCLGLIFFSFQIYGDFSGYSDIAIGSAKMLGIELMSNFKFPYFSRNLAEFWKRWHISLSSWFQTYVYIPLGGSRKGKYLTLRNIAIVFLISGFWHGANFTFIVWGALHAFAFIPLFLGSNNHRYKNTIVAQNSIFPTAKELLQIIYTFSLVTLFWVFFRSENMTDAYGYLKQIIFHPYFELYNHPRGYRMVDYFILLAVFIVYEYVIRNNERSPFNFKSKYLRFIIYSITILSLFLFYDDMIDRSFIYFQF